MQKHKFVTRFAALFLLASMSLAVPAALAQDATVVPTTAATVVAPTTAATEVGTADATAEQPVGVITRTADATATTVTAETGAAGGTEATHETPAADEGGPLTPLGINTGLLCVHLINFLMVAALLTTLLWKPAVNFLDTRSAQIQKGLEDAAAAARARQNAEAEAEKVLAEARASASHEINEARTRGEDVAKTIQSDARSEAERALATARTEAEGVKTAELAGMRDQVIQVAVALAGRIIKENLDAGKQSALVADFLTRLPAAARGMAGHVEVTSAMPLSDAEQTQVKTQLGSQDVAFRVDPSILGGLIVKSQDRVVDGSARSNLNTLSSSLS